MTDKEMLEEIKEKTSSIAEPMLYINWHDVKWLIKQAERVQELEEQLQGLHKMYDIRLEKSDEFEEQNKRYREALEFYADREKYSVRMDELELPEDILHAKPRITYDMGRKARKALEETK